MRRLIAVPTALLALTVAACGGSGPDDTAASPAASGSGPGASPTKTLKGGPDGGGSAHPSEPGGSPSGVPGQPLDCGALPDAMGEGLTARLFSGPGAGPAAGCAEARSVMAEFFRKADADQPSLTVRGWECQYEAGPTGTWLSSCRKDGGRQQMHTEEAGRSSSPDAPGESPGDPGQSELPGGPEVPQGPGLPGGGEESQTSIRLPRMHV
ncbi:hypothetical protein [Streptomyces paromomycinus]|uniref:Lipoprotein n=1 Tax=Streptomyces paromomycinus TaxID=92743 RepID=A0A401WDK3_STREY|nr:hypothetical protein [Streptomyces paromomycinus]GCD47349.1 hypothetical protein GKJPGBOP_07115 [Streptomyces paromomycinus]